MSGDDPLAAWRGNPFFVLEVSPHASRAEVERAGQKLLALLEVDSATAGRYDTPFGPATRDPDTVRQAVAALRDPLERIIHELLADVAPGVGEARANNPRGAWTGAGRVIGWIGKWPE